MKIRVFEDQQAYNGTDENGDGLYPELVEFGLVVDVKTIEGSVVNLQDGRHMILFPSEYEVVS